ncbi:molybdopterin-dependent oxidoreductase [Cupriavidus respiraculi]|uniref:Oxidoreductase molybdopterin-binding domain-containing protein n=1 Tax=Cupriavidus respiraculi TaxID=195930 RepID=A0ABN7YFY1_9BURK|nr:molybdopterin-dependent oxidoreductase [Cupriavidus respiraculi]CAG9171621.1 hypothetical protein LMG21510_01738 [Cupriavidus respiraculi]
MRLNNLITRVGLANTRPVRRLVGDALLSAACLAGMPVMAQGADTLEVKGALLMARSLTLDDLGQLPQTEIVETRSIGAGPQPETTQVKWGRVLLRDILLSARFPDQGRRDAVRTVVVARASDGYLAVFSWGELFNSKVGDSVLVVTSMNGQPLPPTEGQFALRALSDTRPGPRHVRLLTRIEVLAISQ